MSVSTVFEGVVFTLCDGCIVTGVRRRWADAVAGKALPRDQITVTCRDGHIQRQVRTARGKAGVAVIRISGPESLSAVAQLGAKGLLAHKASLRRLYSKGGQLLDEAVVIHFPEGHSFTGEDVGEFQIHGGRAVVEFCLAAIGRIEGVRMAEPGEFTRRAFENSKLDLWLDSKFSPSSAAAFAVHL